MDSEEKSREMFMKKRNDEKMAFIQELQLKGHTCIIIIQTYPVQVDWCEKETCENAK